MQLSIVPVVCTRLKPPPSTAAADFIGYDDRTTHFWLCKGQGRHPWLPATEWVGSHLAQACGLPVPPWSVVERFDQPGVPYFGSQWQGGAIGFVEARGRVSNAEVFARTHAVDLFSHNTDRHYNNFLFLDLAGDVIARVIDFSHALLVAGWPLPPLPMLACNTTDHLPILLEECRTPYVRPTDVLAILAALPADWMHDILQAMPQEWLDDEHRRQLSAWWSGPQRQERLDAAESCLP